MLSLRDAVAEALLPRPTPPKVNGPLVSKPTPVWECVSNDSEYADYEHYVDDVNGYGARMRISLCHKDQTAYVTVVIDDTDGERYIEDAVPGHLPWAVALAMTQHTPN